jgi:methylase of polypeptide subunit release factors
MNIAHAANADLPPLIHWDDAGVACSARWRSESGLPPPKQVRFADDQTSADTAFRLASSGTALLWRGDFQNARQLLQAMSRRAERRTDNNTASAGSSMPASPAEAFARHRQAQARRAGILGMLLIPLAADYTIPLRRAPDLRLACAAAYGPADITGSSASCVALRELLGLVGAYEWRRKGVPVAALGARVHPHYGVFAPIRDEYVGLVAEMPLPDKTLAYDIGTGTGVLAAVLAQRGVARVVATDQDARALACARENIERLGYGAQIEVIEADLFPDGPSPLIVCNPPWLPAQPTSALEYAVYDPESRMLLGFLNGLAAHLTPKGEGWLVLSDLAEHLGLRTRETLLEAFAAAGLAVAGRAEARPHHPRAANAADPLHQARAAEMTSLWRLVAR